MLNDVNDVSSFQRKQWVQQSKLTNSRNAKYQKNKIVRNGLETISYLRPKILNVVLDEIKKKSVRLAGVKITLQAKTIGKKSSTVKPGF